MFQIENLTQDTWAQPPRRSHEETFETLRCLWPCFRIFRFLGLFPVLKRGDQLFAPNRLCSLLWLPTVLQMVFQIMLFVNTFLILTHLHENQNATVGDTVYRMMYLIRYCQTFFSTVFVIWKVRDIPKFMAKCKIVETICRKYQQQPFTGMFRDSLILLVIVESMHLVSAVLFYIAFGFDFSTDTVGHFLNQFNNNYWSSGSYYSGTLLFAADVYSKVGWNFGNALINSLSLILTRYLIQINKALGRKDPQVTAEIEELRLDRVEICKAVWMCNDIFSPLFLVTYVGNLAYIFSRLYVTLRFDYQSPDVFVRFESIFSMCHLVLFKILLSSYIAARLHEAANAGLHYVSRWTSSVIENRYRFLLIGFFKTQFQLEVGISGCGYFLITKGFILTLIGSLITFAAVIIQFHQASLSP